MLSKQQLNNKLQEKRLKQIESEKTELEIFKQNHLNEIKSIESDIKTLSNKQINLEQEQHDNNLKLQNFKDSDFSIKISQLNTENNNLNKTIKLNNQKIEKQHNENINIKIAIQKEIDAENKDYDLILKSLSLKESQNDLLLKRKIKLEAEHKICDNNINILNKKAKELRGQIHEKSVNNMIQRTDMIEENIFNLRLKKKILKDKKVIEIRIKNEQEKLDNLPNVRKNELTEIYKNYNEIIKDDNVDILNEMNILEKKVSDFELETKRAIFFQKNLVKNLESKMKNLDNLYEFKSIDQKKTIDEKYKLKNEEIKILSKEKEDLFKQKDNLKIDIDFLDSSFKKESLQIQEKRSILQDKFYNSINSKKMKIEESEKNLAKLKDETETNNINLKKEIELNKNKIINLRNNYYEIIKNNQNCDKRIKDDIKKFSSKKDELILILEQKKEKHEIILKEKDNRIIYLETQYLKHTILENQN